MGNQTIGGYIMEMNNILVGQSGGPTAAINATLAGVIAEGIANPNVGTVYGTVNGIKGVIGDNIINLSEVFSDSSKLEILKQTPSAYLGSCRYKLSDETDDISEIIRVLKKHNIAIFLYIGGNDSMDTVLKLKDECFKNGIKVMGIPKTIDNDLMGTDHCPGYGSAAKYIASTVAEIARDAQCYSIESVTLIEIMGRNAGWLTAASSLARLGGGLSPDLIYLPEVPFDTSDFLSDVRKMILDRQNIVIALSEGIKDKDGKYVSDESSVFKEDLFGHVQLGGAGKVLENLIKKTYGIKVRSIELNTPQRCASHIASYTDICESAAIGSAAVKTALGGEHGKMMAYVRKEGSPYKIDFDCIDIENSANFEKEVPPEFISDSGSDVTSLFTDYAYPLIQGELPIIYKDGIPLHISR